KRSVGERCLMSPLEGLESQALAELAACADEPALRSWNTKFLGKAGELTLAVKKVSDLPPPERPAYGQKVNQLKVKLTEASETKEKELAAKELNRSLETDRVDVTLPGRPIAPGRLHPATQMMRKILAIFADMGFQVYRSREVEDDLTNFELLNMP